MAEEPKTSQAAAPPNARRLRWWGRAVAGLVLLVSCGAALWLGFTVRQETVVNEGLVIADEHLQLGELWETERLNWELPIANTSDREVQIAGFVPSCDCLEVLPASLTIPPGETRVCRLKLQLLNQQGLRPQTEAASAQAGPPVLASERAVEITIFPKIAGAPYLQKGWVLRGSVRQAVIFQPGAVSFPAPLVKGDPFPSATVRATSQVPRAEMSVECDPRLGTVSLSRPSQNSAEYLLRISPHEKLPVGPFAFAVRLRLKTQKGETLRSRVLPVRGEVVEDVQAMPSPLYFGTRPVGETASETVVLRSRSGSAFVVEGFENDYPDVTIEPAKRPRAGGEAFALTQRVRESGWRQRTMHFVVRHQRGGRTCVLKVPVQWSFYGMEKP